ncbi:MAG TPA: hypothetical protein VF530_15850 [Planctomycetota bacterium]
MRALASLALKDLAAMLGREESLHTVHATVLRAAHAIRPVVESGTVLAACSDEFNGEVRAAFDRDVARLLSAPEIPGTRRVFAVANMGGRIEPGAIALANQHFSARSTRSGEKLLLIEVTGHVGRRETSAGARWGELDRFGLPSPCCGALRLLLDAPESAQAVRFPWFDQLTAFFGPARLAALRADASPYAMLRAAIVHAVLQAETAIVDLLREAPPTPTHVLLVALVVVNRRGTDNAIPVALHHLHFTDGEPDLVAGKALRSTPGALEVDATRAHLVVRSPFGPEPEPGAAPRPARTPVALAGAAHAPPPPTEPVRKQVARARRQHAQLHHHHGLNVHARAVLRALLQGLSLVAPEVGLAALALESGREVFRAHRLDELLRRGPSSAEARRVLHDLEPTLQQLGQREAREVLEILLAEHHPVLGR